MLKYLCRVKYIKDLNVKEPEKLRNCCAKLQKEQMQQNCCSFDAIDIWSKITKPLN